MKCYIEVIKEGLYMKRAERMIRQKIDELTIYRLPHNREYVQNAIEFTYWNRKISKRKMKKLNDLLLNKCNEVMNNYNEACSKKSDEDYKRFLQMNGLEDDPNYMS